MNLTGHPPPSPLPAARIRALYEQNPSPEGYAMAWEIWRLQRVLIAMAAGLRDASTLRHRQDVIDRVVQVLEYVQGEPCLLEHGPIRPGAKRGGKEDSKR